MSVSGNSYENEVAAVTTNLNFWPRPLVVSTSAGQFAALDPTIQDALRSGAESAFDSAAAATLAEDNDALGFTCIATAELVQAADADLVGIRERLTPVYHDLARDPVTAGFLAELETLKLELGVPPTTAICDAR